MTAAAASSAAVPGSGIDAAPFSGSYAAEDVQFLLRRLPQAPFVSVADKEALIQSGRKHYSEMLSPEALPSARYLQVFEDACAANLHHMARDCLALAAIIAAARPDPHAGITLVSLARAGTPVGVIVRRLLDRVHGRRVTHYSVSIARDRGIDAVALGHIVARGHAPASIVFLDGWTGKGVISRELAQSVAAFNRAHGTGIDGGLYVLSDLAGSAAACASTSAGADYLIPSSILNATVSGLVSRTVVGRADELHGCVYYAAFAPHDQSRRFVDLVEAAALALADAGAPMDLPAAPDREAAAATSRACLERLQGQYGVADVNLIKPGIGEATRVLLRRVPRLLLLRDPAAADVRHLKLLAQQKNVPVVIDESLPYQAVSLIRSALDG